MKFLIPVLMSVYSAPLFAMIDNETHTDACRTQSEKPSFELGEEIGDNPLSKKMASCEEQICEAKSPRVYEPDQPVLDQDDGSCAHPE